MQQKIIQLLKNSLIKLQINHANNININHTKDKKFGDFSSNIAMVLAKQEKINPTDLAKKIIKNLPINKFIFKVEIAGAGFINFFIIQDNSNAIIKKILKLGSDFGKSNFGNKQKILLEFVSANPTGPLHVGHGRGAAYGATLANLLRTTGFIVENEYYVNDAGRQIDILTTSVYLRYLKTDKFPDNGYHGDYILAIADKLKDIKKLDIFVGVCLDESAGGDKEKHIDDLIKNCKNLLKNDYQKILNLTIVQILQDIKNDLTEFGIDYQSFFSEKSLNEKNLNQKIIKQLEKSGDIYLKNNAKWFNTQKYGDEKDRVVMRENGLHTYFASDIAYHQQKFKRGYAKIINIWGADHHGYITRVKAAMTALGEDSKKLEIILIQFVNLYKNGMKLPMSTRSGSFITLKELRDEVGNDATRFFYILRKADQHLDFDIDLALSKTNQNPVFYIQYAYARICSVLAKSEIKNADLSLLNNQYEQDLIKVLNKYNDVLLSASKKYEPHQLAYYLRDLTGYFHSYYNNCEFLLAEKSLRHARLNLIAAVQQVIKNGLTILGVSSPEKM